MRTLRFGVVGCGDISTVYQLPALRQCAGIDPMIVVDVDRARARAVARRFRVPEHHDDYRALVGKVDAALVATPNNTHADITRTLLEAGVHVLCEKPLATSVADAELLLATAARTGTRLMAAHCQRFRLNTEMLKRIIAEGWLGELREMSSGIGGMYDPGRTDFRRQKRLSGGGVLVDLGVHVIDLALWMIGETPHRIAYDQAVLPGWEVETDAEVALEFPSGASASLSCSFTHPLEGRFTVRGTAGWASVPLYDPTELTVFSARAHACRLDGVQRFLFPLHSMYERQIEHFRHAILTGGDFAVPASQVRAGLDIIARCYAGEGRG